MSNIFAVPDKMLEKYHKKLVDKVEGKTYDDVVRMIQLECDRFPNVSMAWPTLLKRKSSKSTLFALEITIKVVDALSKPDGIRHQQSIQYYGRPPTHVAHKRVIDGNLRDITEQALAVIRATKTISEILTALEQTKCSEEDTNS